MRFGGLMGTPVAAWMLDLLAKSVVLFLVAALVALTLRRGAAAARHLVWLCALAALLLLPPLSRVVPGVPVPGWFVFPALSGASPPPAAPVVSAAPDGVATGVGTAPKPSAGPPPSAAPEPVFPWAVVAGGVYSLGVAFVLGRVAVGMRQVRRMERASVPPPDDSPLRALADEAASAMGLRIAVSLRLSDDAPVPMTWGWRRPVVLLPAGAEAWSPDRTRAAVLHELAHVARGDWPAQMFAHLVCAAYWFHPLVWLTASRLRAEGERAADDRVLLAGVPPAEYARHLLDIARLLGSGEGHAASVATPGRL